MSMKGLSLLVIAFSSEAFNPPQNKQVSPGIGSAALKNTSACVEMCEPLCFAMWKASHFCFNSNDY